MVLQQINNPQRLLKVSRHTHRIGRGSGQFKKKEQKINAAALTRTVWFTLVR